MLGKKPVLLPSCCWHQLVSNAACPKQLCNTSGRFTAGWHCLTVGIPPEQRLVRAVYLEQAAASSNHQALHLCGHVLETRRQQCQACCQASPLWQPAWHQAVAATIIADGNSSGATRQASACLAVLPLLPSSNDSGSCVVLLSLSTKWMGMKGRVQHLPA